MDNLTSEGKAIYETVTQASEATHLRHQKELEAMIVAAVGSAVEAAVSRSVGAAVDKAIEAAMETAANDMQAYTDGPKADLLKQIQELRVAKGSTARPSEAEGGERSPKGAAEGNTQAFRSSMAAKGAASSGPYIPPPARRMADLPRPTSSFSSLSHRERRNGTSSSSGNSGHGRPPSVDFPRFDGENPKLWQTRCVDYFDMFDTDPDLWIAVAAMQFEGPAARWLSSVQQKFIRSSWDEFCAAVLALFGRNQHQTLVRKMYRLRQTGSVEEYINQFSELMDQLTAYEPEPDMLHYTTRFVDGLKPTVRMVVAVQRPADLDAAYSITAVQEEVGYSEPEYPHSNKRTSYSTPSRQYKQPTEYKAPSKVRTSDTQKMTSVPEDKLATLKAYRRAKGLCYICGERWGRDHKCNNTVQLHVVQELLEFCATDSVDSDDSEVDLMVLSAETQTADPANSAIRLTCQVAGQEVIFLLDSGSSHSFLSERLASQLAGQQRLSKMQRVRIAGGGQLVCSAWIPKPKCGWSVGGHQFVTDFKILPLQHYDGIIGMDWLSAQGTMSVNWLQKWLSFDYKGSKVVLQGDLPSEFEFTVVELQLIQETQETKVTVLEDVPEEIQQVIASFADNFEEPAGLPPRRSCDHKIPLVEGARPVNIRPYRYSPEQKTEIGRQVKEMLASGVISPSTSPFASPIILVKKKDDTWRLCVD
ncbi:hypothetical protein ACQJBY_026885 [Aegilops geniculata]